MNNEQTANIPVMDPKQVEDLRQLVVAYHDIDNQIKQLRTSIAQRRKNKSELSTRICTIMNDLGLSDVRYSNNLLRFTTRKVTIPANRATIRERLQSMFPTDSEQALQVVLAPRAVEERVSIRKVRVRYAE